MLYFGQLYSSCLKDAGQTEVYVHISRLQEKILAACNHGKEVVIVFNKDIGEALSIACNTESDMHQLPKDAQITFPMSTVFQGNLKKKHTHRNQDESVLPILNTLISFKLTGPYVTKQSEAN